MTSPSRTSGSYWSACSVSRSISSWPFTFGIAGDVEDVLLGVDRRHLAAELLEALDDPHRGITVAP